jgi:C-terminal processing protease CtpA/Prc
MPNIYIYSNVSDLDKAIAELMVDGYIDIGISSFYGVDRDNLNSQIKEQSQLIKACKIVVYSSYRNTMSGNYALQTPRIQSSTSPISGNVGSTQFYGTINTTTYGTNTSYVPYSYEVYNNTVYFMNKATGYRTGMIVQNLTDSLKQSINSNKGVYVYIVVKGTTAYNAEIVPGDIVTKIGLNNIKDTTDYQTAIIMQENMTVPVEIIRNGKLHIIQLRINKVNYN